MVVYAWDYLDFLDMVQRVEYLIDEETKSAKGSVDTSADDFPSYDKYEHMNQKVAAARALDPRANEIFDMPAEEIENFEW